MGVEYDIHNLITPHSVEIFRHPLAVRDIGQGLLGPDQFVKNRPEGRSFIQLGKKQMVRVADSKAVHDLAHVQRLGRSTHNQMPLDLRRSLEDLHQILHCTETALAATCRINKDVVTLAVLMNDLTQLFGLIDNTEGQSHKACIGLQLFDSADAVGVRGQ